MSNLLKTVLAPALLAGSLAAQFSCPDDGYLAGIASNVSGTTDKVLTLNITGADKVFTLNVQRRVVDGDGTVWWENIESIAFTASNCPPVTLPPGCRASIGDEPDSNSDSVDGTATLK